MKIRRRNFRKSNTASNFWPSFTDVMATIALVLFFIMLLTFIQYIVAGKNLDAAAKDLEEAGMELDFLKKDLEESQDKLEASRIEISQASDELRLLQNEIEKTKAEVDEGTIALMLSRIEIDKQKQIIANSNQELGELREKLSTIAVLRVDILTKVRDSIEQRLGETNEQGEPLVTIGANANLILNNSLLFEFGSSDISNEGKALLRQFSLAFEDILNDSEIRRFIDTIHIEGHADQIGNSEDNFELSAQRSYNVINYIFQANPNIMDKDYAQYFAASAFSNHRLIDENDTEEARKKNRRIEISISIKDSSIQSLIDEYLEGFVEATQGDD